MSTIPSHTADADLLHAEGTTFVTLSVGEQLCGIPVLAVRDILGPQVITPIPLAPREIAGSLNLRGRIVTAIDLRQRLRLPALQKGHQAMSVVVDQANELYALLVDQVSEVITLPAASFETTMATLPVTWSHYCSGIYRLPGRLMVVLDVSRLLEFTAAAV